MGCRGGAPAHRLSSCPQPCSPTDPPGIPPWTSAALSPPPPSIHLWGNQSGSGPPPLPSSLSTWKWAAAPPPAALVAISRALGPLLVPTLAWHCLFTCTILPQSHSRQGPSGMAVPSLLPTASTASPMSAMPRAAPWWSVHIIASSQIPCLPVEQPPEENLHIRLVLYRITCES